MSPNDQVLKSFLVSVGFQIDDNAFRRFVNGVSRVDSKMMLLGKTVAAAAVAVEAMTHLFSINMEKLYYASKRTKASVANIQALEYGMQQIGISSDTARASLESMASAVRMNPGLRGLLDGMLGRSTENEDQAKVMLDLVQKLGKMPHMVGSQFAQMFGMDEKTFLMLKDKGPELAAAMEKRIELTRRAGFEAEKAAAAGREYMNSWREILERIEVVTQKMSIEFLPTFRKMTAAINSGLDLASKWKFDTSGAGEFAKHIDSIVTNYMKLVEMYKGTDPMEGITSRLKANILALMEFTEAMLLVGQGKFAEAGAKLKSSAGHFFLPPEKKRKEGITLPIGGAQAASGTPSTGLVEAGSESRYAWNLAQLQEAIRSQRGAAQQKILNEELTRLRSPASAALMSQAGYAPTSASINTGSGGAAGKNITLTQNTHINVNGTSDPSTTARNVAGAQRQVGSEICRNLEGCAR